MGDDGLSSVASGIPADGDIVEDQPTPFETTPGGVSTQAAEWPGYELNKDNQWGWITLYVVTITIAVIGNLLFLVASACTKKTRTTGYYLLINLSIRDILLAALCMPFTLDSEIIALTWNFGDIYCICYRYFYYCFLFFLPLTALFLAFHLFVENCKWNFAGEEGFVPRPWPHTIYIPLIWFFSGVFAVPTAFWSEVRDVSNDLYKNNISYRPQTSHVCMHRGGDLWENGSNYFYILSTVVTFVIPVILLVLPWFALLVQVCACCTRKLRSSEFWLSIITLFLILFFEASRAPFELFNFHHILTNNGFFELGTFLPLHESYKAVMKWAVYAPSLLHPLLYFTFSPEARHGLCILFSRMCACCCTKSASGDDVEMASDDEKGKMLQMHHNDQDQSGNLDDRNVPLQSNQEDEIAVVHQQQTPSKREHRNGEVTQPLLQADHVEVEQQQQLQQQQPQQQQQQQQPDGDIQPLQE